MIKFLIIKLILKHQKLLIFFVFFNFFDKLNPKILILNRIYRLDY